ncbi:hypothetical protein BDN72DRAFT_893161 [Pluteus cervinus]|uniref:Uncharacterized protein n=1 Tax=Pluteus cervinus TaxID=181527 RepID=A0ACD3BA06_9AGAR|nr:hypothetical protein BDN72DRAFT_893161 [Pluteus cervinus]
MSLIPTFRLVSLGSVTFISLIALALSAHISAVTGDFFFGYFTFAAMALAVAILSVLSIPAMITVDMKRKGALTSMIVVEIGWLGLLWVLWLAAGGLGAQATGVVWPSGCGFVNKEVDTMCREFPAVTALSFINWFILFSYTMTILVLSIMAASRGHSVWFSSVSQTDFFAPAIAPAVQAVQVVPVMGGMPVQYTGQYPPNVMQVPVMDNQVPQAGWAGQPVMATSPYPTSGTPVPGPYPQV